MPIATLLAELAGLVGMDRMEIDPVDRGHLVTLTLENVPVRVAMLIALRSSAADFIFTEKRLRVGAGGKVIETVRPAAAAARDRDRDRRQRPSQARRARRNRATVQTTLAMAARFRASGMSPPTRRHRPAAQTNPR